MSSSGMSVNSSSSGGGGEVMDDTENAAVAAMNRRKQSTASAYPHQHGALSALAAAVTGRTGTGPPPGPKGTRPNPYDLTHQQQQESTTSLGDNGSTLPAPTAAITTTATAPSLPVKPTAMPASSSSVATDNLPSTNPVTGRYNTTSIPSTTTAASPPPTSARPRSEPFVVKGSASPRPPSVMSKPRPATAHGDIKMDNNNVQLDQVAQDTPPVRTLVCVYMYVCAMRRENVMH